MHFLTWETTEIISTHLCTSASSYWVEYLHVYTHRGVIMNNTVKRIWSIKSLIILLWISSINIWPVSVCMCSFNLIAFSSRPKVTSKVFFFHTTLNLTVSAGKNWTLLNKWNGYMQFTIFSRGVRYLACIWAPFCHAGNSLSDGYKSSTFRACVVF